MRKIILFVTFLFSACLFGQHSLLEKGEKHLYTNKDSAYFYLDKLYKQSVDNKQWVKAIEALTYSNETSNYHLDLTKLRANLQKEDSIFSHIKKNIDSLSNGTLYKHYYWYDKGSYFYTLHNYDKASIYFFKILNSLEKLPDSIIKNNYSGFLTAANSYLATMYRNEFKYELAEEFYEENLRLHKKFKDNQEQIYATKDLIASLKSAQKEYKTSNGYAKESVEYYLNNFPSDNNFSSLLSTSALLIDNYIKIKQLDSAIFYMKKVEPFILKNNKHRDDFLEFYAEIYKQEGKYIKALNTYKKILQKLIKDKSTGDKIALLHKDLGDVYFLNDQPEKALEYYDKGLQMFNVDITKGNNNQYLKANSETNILQLINASSKAHNKLGNISNYKVIIENGYLTIEKLNTLRKTYNDDSDKQVLVENVLPIFEYSIEASYQLYKTTENTAFIDTAFTFFERSKSTILLDALYKNNAARFSGIPDDVLEKEKLLKLEIIQLEKKVQRQDSDAQNKLFKLKREYEALVQNMEVSYSAYYNLKYNIQIASVKQVQKNLKSKELVISYFYGEQAVYVISITRTNTLIYKIKIDKRDIQNIQRLQQMLSDPKTSISDVAKVSFIIYHKFLKPILPKTSKKKLLIMPDGILRNIPFESLNTTENGINFLINDLTVSYTNSATLWFQLKAKKENHNRSLLAFAPNFNTSSIVGGQHFSNLPNTVREVEKISKFYNGKMLIGKDATLKNFRDNLKNYGIIHLATHAQTDDELPEYSFLAFTPNTKKEYLMYVNELYAIDLNANLVTLSACNTGVGNLQKGEGFISLARAFFYSGAHSLVNTLWNINDNSSSEIMESFYMYLSKGLSKDEALQKAKLAFLKKHKEDKFSHPYYWSSFVISGNTKPLTSNSNIIWYLVGGVLLLMFIVLRKKLHQFMVS